MQRVVILAREQKGGLGNQLMNYAAAYTLAKRTNSRLYLVDEMYGNEEQRQYSETSRDFLLDKFDLKYDKIISLEDYNEFDNSDAIKLGLVNYHPSIVNKTENIIMNDYFLHYRYFKDYYQEIQEMIRSQAKLQKSDEYLFWENKIKKSLAIAVHLRLGDLENYYGDGNRKISVQYQVRAMQFITELLHQRSIEMPLFFVFTDSSLIARQFFSNTANVKIVSNGTMTSIEEFYLMMNCKHFIIPTSTFSWMAAYVSNSNDKIVIAPEYDWPKLYDFKTYQKPSYKFDERFWSQDKMEGWWIINPFLISADTPRQIKRTNVKVKR
ncbi:glycosyl transferase family 11 [Stylonychia lemnae]|uniref:Glycosyl transferase family 11 n=1 Tax=Stylonychia lemnae TaxID=5949 RepID=A0A078AX02_STYLE|nr:glycosyl transferase family 11 [Stylonychia lemnae]|eukprot:CDW86970.1 glycosyl transferase family 11 [Stylonychia lemnae]